MRLVREADGYGGLRRTRTRVQEATRPAHTGVGQPGVGRHPVGVPEGAQQREGAAPQVPGELLQGGWFRHARFQHGTRACGDPVARRGHDALWQRAAVEPEQPGDGDPQQGVGGERVALVGRAQDLVDEADGVGVVEHGTDETGVLRIEVVSAAIAATTSGDG